MTHPENVFWKIQYMKKAWIFHTEKYHTKTKESVPFWLFSYFTYFARLKSLNLTILFHVKSIFLQKGGGLHCIVAHTIVCKKMMTVEEFCKKLFHHHILIQFFQSHLLSIFLGLANYCCWFINSCTFVGHKISHLWIFKND